MTGQIRLGVSVAAFVAAIVAANWLTGHYGFVPVGFGLMATAGTFAAGATFVFRDAIQEAGGTGWVIAAIIAGGAVSWAVSPARLALASTLAFLLSELVDFAVYTPLRRRRFTVALVASNIAGAVVDTLAFLALAGFAVTSTVVAGQLVGKAWMTVLALAVLVAFRGVSARAPAVSGDRI